MTDRVGVVVMAYGTPARVEDIEAYYTHIRRGRPPTAELLEDLTARYAAIGGLSPLASRTEAQRAGLARALEARAPGRWDVVLGQKHAAPFIEDAVEELAGRGVNRTVGVVLAPHYAGFSVGEYQRRAREAAALHGVTHVGVDRWWDLPAWQAFQAGAVADALAACPADRPKVLFTAHSLPERVLVDDPYPDELAASAAAVAERVGLDRWAGFGLAWQSAGRTPEPWRGPDILEVVRALAATDTAATGRADGVVVCAQGFTSDHLEVRYDLDIEAAGVAAEVGLAFGRTAMVEDDPAVLGELADRVVALVDGAGA